MSNFEQTAKPLLTTAIQGQPTTWLSVSERTIVARWAFKTALMVDRSSHPTRRTTPDKDFRYLFKHQEPPPSASILVGRYSPQAGEDDLAVWAGNAWTTSRPDLPMGDELDGYRVSFSVGRAIFRVYGISRHESERFVVDFDTAVVFDGTPVPDAFRRLWPETGEPHEWPPLGVEFSTGALAFLEPGGS
jgi:hypothetical protein